MTQGKAHVALCEGKEKRVMKRDEWIVVENTHQGIVTKEVWLEAQQINSANKKETVRRDSNGEVSIFAGIIKCACCGGNLVYSRKQKKSCVDEFFKCSTYVQKGKTICPVNRIDFQPLYDHVLADIQDYAVLAVEDERKLIDRILKSSTDSKEKSSKRYEKQIREAKNRVREIDGIVGKLYEDKLSGEITADIFKHLSAKFMEEHSKYSADIEQMESEYAECQRTEQDMGNWIQRVKDCLSIDAVTRTIAVELIDHIDVALSVADDGETYMDLEIFYKFGLTNTATKQRAS
jgi:hypothetical protein